MENDSSLNNFKSTPAMSDQSSSQYLELEVDQCRLETQSIDWKLTKSQTCITYCGVLNHHGEETPLINILDL